MSTKYILIIGIILGCLILANFIYTYMVTSQVKKETQTTYKKVHAADSKMIELETKLNDITKKYASINGGTYKLPRSTKDQKRDQNKNHQTPVMEISYRSDLVKPKTPGPIIKYDNLPDDDYEQMGKLLGQSQARDSRASNAALFECDIAIKDMSKNLEKLDGKFTTTAVSAVPIQSTFASNIDSTNIFEIGDTPNQDEPGSENALDNALENIGNSHAYSNNFSDNFSDIEDPVVIENINRLVKSIDNEDDQYNLTPIPTSKDVKDAKEHKKHKKSKSKSKKKSS